MTLVDTSVWVEHLRARNEHLARLLDERLVVMHPFVLGELLLGGLASTTQTEMQLLPRAEIATPEEVEKMIAMWRLARRGLGYVDAHLAASAMISRTTVLTRDRRLQAVVGEMGVSFRP